MLRGLQGGPHGPGGHHQSERPPQHEDYRKSGRENAQIPETKNVLQTANVKFQFQKWGRTVRGFLGNRM